MRFACLNAQRHFSLVKEKLTLFRLIRCEVNKGLAGGTPGFSTSYMAAGHLIFDSLDNFQVAFSKVGDDLMDDIPKYTDIEPQIQISEIVQG